MSPESNEYCNSYEMMQWVWKFGPNWSAFSMNNKYEEKKLIIHQIVCDALLFLCFFVFFLLLFRFEEKNCWFGIVQVCIKKIWHSVHCKLTTSSICSIGSPELFCFSFRIDFQFSFVLFYHFRSVEYSYGHITIDTFSLTISLKSVLCVCMCVSKSCVWIQKGLFPA